LLSWFDVGYSGLDLKGMKVYCSPLKLYEYMAMGKPGGCFGGGRLTSSAEQETGFFQPGDREGPKQALVRRIAREQLSEMGCKAREEVMANHSWIARMHDWTSRANFEGEGAVMGSSTIRF